jgi:large subunit ribosomal protein L4
VNKKVSRLARKSALSVKASAKNLRVLEDFTMEAPKTKDYVAIIKALELVGKKTLLVTAENQSNIALSANNHPKSKVVSVDSLNTYDIMNANVVLVCEGAVQKINDILKK